jgi:toxin ParE1/3/4
MVSYRLTRKARADLKRIWLYGRKNYGEQKTEQYHRGLLEHLDQIAGQPYLYQAVDYIRTGYRRSVYGTESIYYRINGDMVEIMAILGKQNTEDWL